MRGLLLPLGQLFGTNLDFLYKSLQNLPIQLLNMGVLPGQCKEIGIIVLGFLRGVGQFRFAQQGPQSGGLLLQVSHHALQPLVIQTAFSIVRVELGHYLVDGQQSRLGLFLLQLSGFYAVLAAELLQRFLHHGLHLLIGQRKDRVQILPHDLQQVGVPYTDASAGIGNVLPLMGAGEIPVFLPLTFIDCPAGTQGVAALGANGDAGEDALAHLLVGSVIP